MIELYLQQYSPLGNTKSAVVIISVSVPFSVAFWTVVEITVEDFEDGIEEVDDIETTDVDIVDNNVVSTFFDEEADNDEVSDDAIWDENSSVTSSHSVAVKSFDTPRDERVKIFF